MQKTPASSGSSPICSQIPCNCCSFWQFHPAIATHLRRIQHFFVEIAHHNFFHHPVFYRDTWTSTPHSWLPTQPPAAPCCAQGVKPTTSLLKPAEVLNNQLSLSSALCRCHVDVVVGVVFVFVVVVAFRCCCLSLFASFCFLALLTTLLPTRNQKHGAAAGIPSRMPTSWVLPHTNRTVHITCTGYPGIPQVYVPASFIGPLPSTNESSTNFAYHWTYQSTVKTKHQVRLFDFLSLHLYLRVCAQTCSKWTNTQRYLEAHTSVSVRLKRKRWRDADSCSHVAFIDP